MTEKGKVFNTEGEDVGLRWRKWFVRFDLYLQIHKIKVDAEQVDNLLFYIGECAHEKYLPLAKVTDKFADVVKTLNAVFNSAVNVQMNIFKFYNIRQHAGEPFDEFVTRVRGSASSCSFADTDIDNQVKSQVIQGCSSVSLRRTALEKQNLVLAELIKMGLNTEAVDEYLLSSNGNITCGYQSAAASNNINRLVTDMDTRGRERRCFKCGGPFPHERNVVCPAIGVNCSRCGRLNHLEAVCRRGITGEVSNGIGGGAVAVLLAVQLES